MFQTCNTLQKYLDSKATTHLGRKPDLMFQLLFFFHSYCQHNSQGSLSHHSSYIIYLGQARSADRSVQYLKLRRPELCLCSFNMHIQCYSLHKIHYYIIYRHKNYIISLETGAPGVNPQGIGRTCKLHKFTPRGDLTQDLFTNCGRLCASHLTTPMILEFVLQVVLHCLVKKCMDIFKKASKLFYTSLLSPQKSKSPLPRVKHFI